MDTYFDSIVNVKVEVVDVDWSRVKQEHVEAAGKYSVNDAVWIATALMAMEKYDANPDVTRSEMYFKQSEIVKKAQMIASGKVDAARVSWWVNGDNEKSTQNYLRADQSGNPSTRRLSMVDEFSDKTYPAGLDEYDEFEMNGKLFTMKELFEFVNDVYPKVMKKMQTVDIDYIGVLNYLANNQGIPYSNPYAENITEDEKNNLLAIKQRGQNAVAEMKKMAVRCEALYGLDKCLPGSWLDGSNTKTRKYLWTQMKYKSQAENPISISLFVEKNDGVARYRISLEIKNDGADKKIMKKYHSHLDIPAQPGMVYVSGSNEWGNPSVISGSQEDIKVQVEDGTLRKVQLCIYIETTEGKTNEEFDAEIMEAVKKMIPYYEHVIGKEENESGRAWLLTWNPDNWDWEDYEEQCVATKQGATCIIPWTCSSKQPVEGDEVFLIKIGDQPRGIIAHGRVAKAAYQAPHYNPAKAAQGVMTGYVDAEYDWIQNYETENMLSQNDLKERFTVQQWSPMGSGIEIKAEVFPELRKMWKALIGADDEKGIEEGPEASEFDKNMILYGPPGTGKTYNTAIYAVAICTGKSIEEVSAKPYENVMDEYDKLKKAGRVAFTTFHQSYGYEEFIEGIKPIVDQTKKEVGYTVEPGVFKNFCNDARNIENNATEVVENVEPYVFIIDEINRGNISKIFGELITLIEGTKRAGMEEAASAVLPYSGDTFSVPSNVYILGTMNTADRSIALMDTALRRRFQFIEMMPDANVLRKIGADKVEDLDVAAMLETINERITFLYDREHTIGHAFFTKLAKDSSIDVLRSIFEKSVIPLLQEYFYEDYQKIQLVLGDNGKKEDDTKFILDEDVKVKDIFKGNADDIVDLPEKKYSINKKAFDNIDAYKQIM